MYTYKAKVLSVTDGDTMVVEINLGFNIKHELKIRLSRINTPEVYGIKKESPEYQKGLLASQFTKNFIASTNNIVMVTTFKDAQEKYGRFLAEVWATEGVNKDLNLNEELLKSGNALLYS